MGLQTRYATRLEGRMAVAQRGDAAIIPVIGFISRYDDLLTRWLGARSVEALALDLSAALENPAVKRIILEIDSPGGVVTGINELAKHIRTANAKKPVTAYIGGLAASAAYWLASAAGRIVVSETSLLGSIGVMTSFRDTSRRDEKAGVRRIDIVSSQSPDKRLDATTDDGRAKLQSMVDSLADVFVSSVAGFRNVSPETVRRDFGRGGLLVGADAVRARMVDGLGTLEGILAGASPKPAPKRPAATAPTRHAASSDVNAFNALGASIFARRRQP